MVSLDEQLLLEQESLGPDAEDLVVLRKRKSNANAKRSMIAGDPKQQENYKSTNDKVKRKIVRLFT